MGLGIQEIKDKAVFFFKNQSPCHIDTKDLDFYNGILTEYNLTYLVIRDRVKGLVPVAFSEINVIKEFKEKK